MEEYYVEVTISGSICVGKAESEEAAREMVQKAISGETPDKDIMESIGTMVRNRLDCGEVDVGDAFLAE